VVVQGAEEAAGRGGDLFDERLAEAAGVARREGLAGAKLEVRRDRHEEELDALEEAGEGEDEEFGGHVDCSLGVGRLPTLPSPANSTSSSRLLKTVLHGNDQVSHFLIVSALFTFPASTKFKYWSNFPPSTSARYSGLSALIF
jgi:hypothetical protein